MKKYSALLAFAALQAAALSAAFGVGFLTRDALASDPLRALAPSGSPEAERYPILHEVRALLEARYIQPLPDDRTLEYGAVRGLLSAVGDPYTVFVEPRAHTLESQSLQGEYGGVGVQLSKNAAGEIVLAPFVDSPAAVAGLLEGDVLLAIDDMLVTSATTLDEATALIRGLVGTRVTLRVRHPSGREVSAAIVRQNFPLPSVTWRQVEGQTSVGLITVQRFSGKTPDEVQRAADELRALGATQLVLDLRNNGGGILDAAVAVASKFLDGGVVMYETRRDAPEQVYSAPANATWLASAPLVALVNHSTASAAEIVAGALLDRGRAPLIGQTTFGKGSVQLVFDLSDGSSVHVTAHLWYTPTRRQLDRVGLPPTLAVEPANDGSDPELAQAIEHLLRAPQAGQSP